MSAEAKLRWFSNVQAPTVLSGHVVAVGIFCQLHTKCILSGRAGISSTLFSTTALLSQHGHPTVLVTVLIVQQEDTILH